MVELVIYINNKKVVNYKEFKEAFNQLKDGKHLITIKDLRKRSIHQNNYYWGVIVPTIRKGLYDAGYDDVQTNDDAHQVLKYVLNKKEIINKQTGEMIHVAGSTAKLSISEFNNFIERICKWAAEYLGIIIPSPYQTIEDFSNWNNNLKTIF